MKTQTASKMKIRQVKRADPREVELKFRLPPGSRAILEASRVLASVEAEQKHQITTYFDTPDNFLAKSGLTLRVRRGGDTRIQTVKSSADGRSLASSRSEWEWPIGQDVPDLGPLDAVSALAKIAKAIDGRLKPVFVTDIRRTTRLLHLDENTLMEVAIDEGSIETGIKREPVSELELELKGGNLGALYRLATELLALTPLWISPESKSSRGWHLRTGQCAAAQSALTPALKRRAPAATGFHETLGGMLGHLMANIAPTLRDNAEGLHQMRLAIRGARAALKLFGRHLDRAAAGRFDAALQQIGGIFGAARDWDVFCLETLPAAMAEMPKLRLDEMKLAAEAQRQTANAAVADSIRGQEFTAMVLELAAWAEAGKRQPSSLGDAHLSKRLATLAPSLLDRVASKVKERGRRAGRLSAPQRHGLRKALRKLSYGVDSLAGLYRPRAVKIYRGRCGDLLTILGTANDAVVTRLLAAKLVAADRPDLASPASVLAGWSRRRGRKALKGLKGALKALRAAPVFWS